MTTPPLVNPRYANDNRFSLREASLLVGIAVNFGAVVWFAATIQSAVTALQASVGDLSTKVGRIESGEGPRAVLEYRIAQLEAKVEKDIQQRRAP